MGLKHRNPRLEKRLSNPHRDAYLAPLKLEFKAKDGGKKKKVVIAK